MYYADIKYFGNADIKSLIIFAAILPVPKIQFPYCKLCLLQSGKQSKLQ